MSRTWNRGVMPWEPPRKGATMAKRTEVPAGKRRVTVATGMYLKASGKDIVTYRDPGHRQHCLMREVKRSL